MVTVIVKCPGPQSQIMTADFTASLPSEFDRMVIFDCDGVLAYQKGSWATIHEKFGTIDHQQEHLAQYRNGELDMVEWSERTVEHWAGRSAATLEVAASEATPISGFEETIATLKELDFAVGVVSAGVLQYVEHIVGDAPVDFIVSNSIKTADGELTGEVQVNVTDLNKGQWFKNLVEACEVPTENVVLVGDAQNDLVKTHPGNLSIAFNPQDEGVRDHADSVITDGDLRLILDPIREWLATTAIPSENSDSTVDLY